jgi:hypothetical protein
MSDDGNQTQPFGGPRKRRHRQYIHAEWAAPGAGGGHPKLSGGVTIDDQGNVIQARAFNRPDQRYDQSEAELTARRLARAAAEKPNSVVLMGAGNIIEFRAESGNNYDLMADGTGCDCPDQWRLNESGKTGVVCKHSAICASVLADVGGYDFLPLATSKIAELIGIDVRTAEHLCQIGFIVAAKVNGVWVIPNDTATVDQIDAYKAKIIGEMPELDFLV